MGQGAAQAAHDVSQSRWVERLARGGYVATGLIHIAIGWIAAQIALGGGGGGSADQSGALSSLRSAPGGAVLLWVCVLGFAALALWHLLDAVVTAEEIVDRAKEAVLGVVYAVLGLAALTFARGGSTDGEQTTDDLTTTLMGMPFGRVLVGVVGLVIIGVGGYHVYKGVSEKFLEDLRTTGGGTVGTGVRWAGILGHAAKGVALLVVGILFAIAAWKADPDEAGGLDTALKTLAEQPFGAALLGVVALGLVLYGIYSFARARYGRM